MTKDNSAPRKLVATDLVLELTRDCNMRCAHCLRGDSDSLDMPVQVIENAFSAASEIRTLTFTGGEPSLKPHLIKYALSCAKKYRTKIDEVYLATNGREVSDEFLDALRDWHMHLLSLQCPFTEKYIGGSDIRSIVMANNAQSEPCGVHVDISMDRFHDDIPVENVLKLCTLPNIRIDKYRDAGSDDWALHVGRAYWNGIGDPETESSRPWAYGENAGKMELDLDHKDRIEYDGMIYINAEGHVLTYCDYSYDEQDEHIIGTIAIDKLDDAWAGRLYECHKNDLKSDQDQDPDAQGLYEIKLPDQAAVLLKIWFPDNPAAPDSENCGACIKYAIHDLESYALRDGGETDYDSETAGYKSTQDALDDIIRFAFDGAKPEYARRSGLDPNDMPDK